MASRESYNIRVKLKYSETIKDKLLTLFYVIKEGVNSRYIRKLILLDNIITPYNKLIRCKIKPHVFIHDDFEDYYWCKKCHFHLYGNEYNKYIRKQKIKKLKRKL